jgi:hypothetical protein
MSSAERCGSEQRSRYFPSGFASLVILLRSMRSRPFGVTRRNRCSPGMVEIRPRNSARFEALSRSVSAISAPSLPVMTSRNARSRSGAAVCSV